MEESEVLDAFPLITHSAQNDFKNLAYRRADKQNLPLMWVEERQKYAHVHIDFITAEGVELSESALAEVKEMLYYYLGKAFMEYKDSHKSSMSAIHGKSIVDIDGLIIGDAWGCAGELAQIIYDEANYQEITLK